MPRGVKNAETEVKEKDVSVDAENKNDLFAQMMEQMKQMQAQIEVLQKEKTSAEELVKVLKSNKQDEEDSEELKLDDDITVISQCVGGLTLSTDGKGEGMVYRFSHFGEIQDIPWGDLKDICRNMKSLAQKGAFYIANEKAVEKAKLKTYYNRMLNNEDILHLFERDANTIVELYKLANDFQKETIIDLVANKKMKGEQVDGGVLYALSDLSGKKLMDM